MVGRYRIAISTSLTLEALLMPGEAVGAVAAGCPWEVWRTKLEQWKRPWLFRVYTPPKTNMDTQNDGLEIIDKLLIPGVVQVTDLYAD